MKILNTPEQIAAVIAALAKIHKRPFDRKSGDPKYNAQRNLSGMTHYFEDDTLKFHKGRVNTSGTLAGGLLFFAGCSDAGDMNGTFRVHRYVVHDLFGSTIYRPSLDEGFKTEKQARKAFEAVEIDLVKHYHTALVDNLNRVRSCAVEMEMAIQLIAA